MNLERICGSLNTEWIARDVEFFPVIDSTNNVAKAAGMEGRESGFLAVADRQDAGRGSRGRSWVSPEGYNIFMSLMIRPGIPMDKAAGLTLVMALSISEAVDKLIRDGGISEDAKRSFIKWPNDIVLNKRKICGILTELHQMPDQKDYFVVIGVGINVNQPIELFPEEIRDTAGSIFSETGKETDRAELVACCMKCFESNYEKYVESQNLSALKDNYEKRLINIGKEVKILDPKGEYEAVAEGITDDGSLLISLADGRRETINAGEVSVRGLYGYV
ncbi:biotin--[acetyl-CoA-carboxylase] ligase [Butyrivibrio sp. INlla16]|uniref:biotin--[acetyl-CoA-carboxylase] ligase n=1 Tax=Butyrivibrio sp. INlla16 TaxID=1520807 RepID=UPI00088137A3|nr:biotin--[acetyl-CoA-carboxylase] ligase [Butyrivibrio sp. INlla16]SDB14293.1 BirA family transcriptional regulator, biotin operon repressor / biotin-[acetyl-CoA-carboxylase] ligase [Butyrivibrio sp. INlla16]